MKLPEPILAATYPPATLVRSHSQSTSELDCEAKQELEPHVSLPSLQPRRRPLPSCSGPHVVGGGTLREEKESLWSPTILRFPKRSTRRDLGLWLLGGSFTRLQGWSRVDTESVADALPSSTVSSRVYEAVKRVCDFAVALLLLILLLPAFALIAALVKVDSPGPALFCQDRIGRNARKFVLWKFRSMQIDAPKYARSPTTDKDPRLTRMGRLLRRISVDELPQLVNVLKGEMSLVGPRPEMPFIVDCYTHVERRRLGIKPGITGLWQISSRRSHPIHENLQYDLHYIRNQNLILDLSIVLRTVVALVNGQGAV
jgi:lipopolysaccharide/colanic/teichoic acid biosynthesis glycosyltransferase